MAKKWVIQTGSDDEPVLVIGNVKYHRDLVSGNVRVLGGGYWLLQEEEKRLYLYGCSGDFGFVDEEWMLEHGHKAVNNAMDFEGYTVYFSMMKGHFDALMMDKYKVIQQAV